MAEINDATTTLKQIKQEMRVFAEARDWLQFHSPKNLSMAISTEAAELMEIFLWMDTNASKESITQIDIRDKLSEEMADILLFLVQLSNVSGIDLAEAVFKKIDLNSKKYPITLSKGNAKKYTELID